jgi:hypothetical protein
MLVLLHVAAALLLLWCFLRVLQQASWQRELLYVLYLAGTPHSQAQQDFLPSP